MSAQETLPPPSLHQLPEDLRRLIVPHCGCWLWRGRLNRNGYGRSGRAYGERMVHRVVYELLVGPIKHGLVLDHRADLCAHRACCNPAHMEPVTVRENTLRGRAVLYTPAQIGWLKSRGIPRELPLASRGQVAEDIPF